jgi:hypothetical protein
LLRVWLDRTGKDVVGASVYAAASKSLHALVHVAEHGPPGGLRAAPAGHVRRRDDGWLEAEIAFELDS